MRARASISTAHLLKRLERIVVALEKAERRFDAANAAFDAMVVEVEATLDARTGSNALLRVERAMAAVGVAGRRCARVAVLVQRHVALIAQRIVEARAVPGRQS